MKKKLLSLIIAFSAILTACGQNTDTTVEKEPSSVEETATIEVGSEEPSTAESSTSTALTVDENLFTVEITLPKDMLGEDVTQESLDQSATENGFKSITLNPDGSATYVMSKKKHKEYLEELKTSLSESCNSLIDGENAIESFEEIKFNDNMSKFDVYVDKETFSDWDTLSLLSFYIYGGYYQAFSGIDGEDIDVEVNFIDKDTNEVLESGKLSDTADSSTESVTEAPAE